MHKLAIMLAVGLLGCSGSQKPDTPPADKTESLAQFERVAQVLEHPRCMNCHPSDERPRWGEAGDIRTHPFEIVRGSTGFGAPGLDCTACHGDANYDPAGVPGDPHWRLAPGKMGWMGLDRGELCRAIKDPKKNGGRTLDQLVEHMVDDSLVAWAWNPGLHVDGTPREKPPLTKDEFDAAVRRWAETGAHCPR